MFVTEVSRIAKKTRGPGSIIVRVWTEEAYHLRKEGARELQLPGPAKLSFRQPSRVPDEIPVDTPSARHNTKVLETAKSFREFRESGTFPKTKARRLVGLETLNSIGRVRTAEIPSTALGTGSLTTDSFREDRIAVGTTYCYAPLPRSESSRWHVPWAFMRTQLISCRLPKADSALLRSSLFHDLWRFRLFFVS